MDEAVSAAKRYTRVGFDEYASSRKSQNGKKIGEYLLENIEEIAPLLSMEAGKTLFEAKFEVTNAARYFEYYGIRQKPEGRSIPLGSTYYDFTSYEPTVSLHKSYLGIFQWK